MTANSIGYISCCCEVVRDEQAGEACFALDVPDQIEDLRLHGHIERADGFVKDNEARRRHERAGDRDTLALAPRQFMGKTICVAHRQPHALKHCAHEPTRALAFRQARHENGLGDRSADAQLRVETRTGSAARPRVRPASSLRFAGKLAPSSNTRPVVGPMRPSTTGRKSSCPSRTLRPIATISPGSISKSVGCSAAVLWRDQNGPTR